MYIVYRVREYSSLVCRVVSVAVLFLTVLLGTAWAQQEGQVEPPADTADVAAVTVGQTGESKSGFQTEATGFGGPASVGAQLEEDGLVKQPAVRLPFIDNALQPWFDWKKKINEAYGLQIGTDYSALYQGANESLSGEEDAASGIFRVFGRWALVGRNSSSHTGTLVLKVENRHTLGTEIPPAGLASSIGYLGITGSLFSEVGWILNDANWQHAFNNSHSGLIVGRYDPNDYIDVLGYANPWTGFQNLAILLNTTIALPDTSYGIGGGTFLKDQWYVLGTLNDANGTIDNLDFFEDGAEFFGTFEVGWTPSRADRYAKNLHVTYWHVDERETKGIPRSDGVTFGANWLLGKEWFPFFRAGWSDGGAPLMEKTVTVGIAHLVNRRSDGIGLGGNWGDPSDATLRDQYTTELFYRLQFAQNLAITPSVQWLVDPALNPDEDQIWVFGLRGRLTL